MPSINEEIAAAFAEIADLLELSGGERFKIVAYRRAAETATAVAADLGDMSDKELRRLNGIGAATAKKIQEFAKTGTMRALEDLRTDVPSGVRDMMGLAGLGPKKAMMIFRELGVTNLDELRAAIADERLRRVPGLGIKTEQNLILALENLVEGADGATETPLRRSLLGEAITTAEAMVASLRSLPGVEQAAYAGSLRRMKETVGDIDLLVAGADSATVMDAFVGLPEVVRVLARGKTKSSVIVSDGMQVDLRLVGGDEYGAALQYFTGSQRHNVRLREIAVKRGLKLSEYGLFRVAGGMRIAGETEEEIYSALEMQTPAPTLREDRGEIEAASAGELPDVVEVSDIKGDLHSHTHYSDGKLSILEMAQEAVKRKYAYWAVTDHGLNVNVRSLDLEDIERQKREIEEVRRKLGKKITLLHGVELNIGPQGELDYPDEVLANFDICVASTHRAPWDRRAMTRRLIAAIQNPWVNILGHPTGRRFGSRTAAEFDYEAVFKAAAANNVALEINSNPQRLDLKDEHARLAWEFGNVFSIDTDAHKPADIDNIRLGVGTAQRGWLTSADVINTWPLSRLRKFLRG